MKVSWTDLVDWSREKDWGGVHDYERLGWFSARFEDESLNGTFEGHGFSSGFQVLMVDFFVAHDLEIAADQPEPMAGFGLATSGSCGKTYWTDKGRTAEMRLNAGQNIAGACHGTSTRSTFAGGQWHKVVNVRLKRALVPNLIEEWDTQLSRPLNQILLPSGSTKLFPKKTLSPTLEHICHQMLHCPYSGSTRRLFVEAKALEILACQLEEFSEPASENRSVLSAADLERLHGARDILDTEYADPPSLLALARRVGLNDWKLKRGFREVFGTTVFGYVRRLRMEKARGLLESSDLSVTEVALAVGYTSFGHFAAAFKRSFGVLPSQYRRIPPRSFRH